MARTSHTLPILTEDMALANFLTTVNTLADAGVFAVRLFKTKHLVFQATTNNLKVVVLGSVDDGVTYPVTVEAEFAVNVGTPVTKTITGYYTHLKVQVKPAVADTHGTLTTQCAAASF